MPTYIYDDPYVGGDAGKLEETGDVYDATWCGGNCVGHVDSGGTVRKGIGPFGQIVGRVDENGFVYDCIFGGSPIGRIDEQGKICDNPYAGGRVGRVEGLDKYRAGAAYLLLLRK